MCKSILICLNCVVHGEKKWSMFVLKDAQSWYKQKRDSLYTASRLIQVKLLSFPAFHMANP